MFSMDERSSVSINNFFPMSKKALTSLGKQDPPYPSPGFKNFLPILSSIPTPESTSLTFAPVFSQ